MRKQLNDLVSTISSHPAVKNQFFDLWENEVLSHQQIAIFARNYWEWTYQFPGAIAALMMISDCHVARTEYCKTLYSEMGYGNPQKVHAKLFEDFFEKLAIQIGAKEQTTFAVLKRSMDCLPETHQLVNWELENYAKCRVYASGAQLAIEWQAYTMLRKLYEGARNYSHLWQDQDLFHEACEFFYAHLGEAEKEHKEESITAAESLIKSDDDLRTVQQGFHQHLSVIENFLDSIS